MYSEQVERKRREMLAYPDWQWFDTDQRIEQRKRIDKAVELLEQDAYRSGYETVSRIEGDLARIMAQYTPESIHLSDETVAAVREARANMPTIQIPMEEPDNKPGRVEIAFVELLRLTAEIHWNEGARAARAE